MITFDQVVRMHVFQWFPHIVAVWVSLPLNEVLELFSASMRSVIEDGLDLVFFFSINQFGWWLDEVRTIRLGFVIWGEK